MFKVLELLKHHIKRSYCAYVDLFAFHYFQGKWPGKKNCSSTNGHLRLTPKISPQTHIKCLKEIEINMFRYKYKKGF